VILKRVYYIEGGKETGVEHVQTQEVPKVWEEIHKGSKGGSYRGKGEKNRFPGGREASYFHGK